MGWPAVVYTEEGMREGMQIESSEIAVADKIRLLDALSETGLKNIVVGSFVSPYWCPQMALIEEIVKSFKPRPGVRYTALALNQRGLELAKSYSPPLTIDPPQTGLFCNMCDVFSRRNTNQTQAQEIARWPAVVAAARDQGVSEAGIALACAFGSNFVGPFGIEQHIDLLARQHQLWDEAGVKVTSVALGDTMSWNMPQVTEELLGRIIAKWPTITTVALHLHNARGMAPLSLYAAMRVLDERFTLRVDGAIGGMGGCPYGGNGRVTGMVATEDVIHMFLEMGIDLGVNLAKLIETVWLAEEVVGHKLSGHVSKAGPLPRGRTLYPTDLPFIETEEQAKHFLLGQSAIGNRPFYPWREPIRSPQRDAVDEATFGQLPVSDRSEIAPAAGLLT